MPGSIFGNINPSTTSGSQLATLLNDFRDIVISGFIGSARPSGLLKGGYWIDNSLEISQGLLRMYMFDGTSDILVLSVNKNTLEVTLPNLSNSVVIKRTTDDSIGAVLKLYKSRITGQVQSGDVIAQITASSTDNTPAEVIDAATIEAVAEQNHTNSAQGTKWDFYTKLLGGFAKTLRMSINSSYIEFFSPVRLKSIMWSDAYTPTGPVIAFRRARGSEGAETAVLNDDVLGFLGALGHNGTNYSTGSKAAVYFRTAESFTTTAQGTKIIFETTANGTILRKRRITVENDGALGLIGDTNGTLKIKPPATVVDHALVLPSAQGAADTYLKNDGSGNLSWAAAGGGATWTKYTISHTALQTAGLTNNTALLTLPIRGIVTGILMKNATAFAGTGITNYTLTVGVTGIEDKYLPNYDALAAVTGGNYSVSSVATGGEDFGATEEIKIFATAVGANLDQSTQGSLEIWVKTETLPA